MVLGEGGAEFEIFGLTAEGFARIMVSAVIEIFNWIGDAVSLGNGSIVGCGGDTENFGELTRTSKLLTGILVARNFAVKKTFFGVAAVVQLGNRISQGDLLG